MTPIVVFDRVGKRYSLHRDRPHSFRDLFVRRAPSRAAPIDPDALWALRDVSFEIEPGETIGLIGANGAGKSTALKLISRVVVPTEGRLAVNGRVSALLELGTGFHPELSGRDNIYLSGALIGMRRDEMSRKYSAIVEFSEIESFIDVPVKHYSSGMFARLAFAVSIHLDPQMLLVDEVLAVGDQAFQRKCLDRIAELQRAGVTICLVSHLPDTVRDLCSRVIWFDHGRVIADGPAESVVPRYVDHSLAAVPKEQVRPSDLAAEQRWGNRRVEIEQVRLLDGKQCSQAIFETGQTLILELDYHAPDPVVDVVFGMALLRHDGLHITGPNTIFAGLPLAQLHGRGTVIYRVPFLPLLDGRYDISVSAHNRSDTEMFDYHDRAYSFRIVNRTAAVYERYGFMTLRGDWQHVPAPDPALAPAPQPNLTERAN